MRKVLAQFLPLIVILVVLASIMRVFATTEKSAGDKLSVWDRFLIALGFRDKPTVEETRKFEYIPGRLQERQPTLPSYQIPQPEAGTYQTPASPPTGGLKNIPPPPPLPPSRPQALGVKTTSSITSFFSGIFRSIIADLGFSKPKPPIPPVSPKTLGVQDQKPPPLPPFPPIPPRAP